MNYHDPRFSAIATWMATAMALVVAIALPAGYFYMARASVAAALATTTVTQAEDIERMISVAPSVWIFQPNRVAEILAHHHGEAKMDLAVVTDGDDNVITQVGQVPPPPTLQYMRELFDSGVSTGNIRIVRSLRGILLNTGFVAFFSVAFAGVLFFVFRYLPLRALYRIADALELEKERAEVTLHSIGDAVIRTDASGKIEYVNPAAKQLTGWGGEDFGGRALMDALPMIDQATGAPIDNPMTIALAERQVVAGATRIAFMRGDGQTVAIETSAAPIFARAGELIGGVLVFRDVTVARRLSTQLSWQASHDALTGLPNRLDFESRVDAAMDSLRAGGPSHVMCYLDLDQFKIVNDTCGHAAGDELLRQIANLFRSYVRGSDVLARLGGDEFGVLLQSCPLDRAQRIAAELLHAVKSYRFAWKDKIFEIGVSIGIVEIVAAMRDRATVFCAADDACYMAKELGRGRVQVYRSEGADFVNRRDEMTWAARIARAEAEDRFALHYQPLLPISPRAGAGRRMELLLRLVDENGELVLPGAFLPAAERYNLMAGIDQWVIKTAFAKCASLASRFGDELVLSINLSGTSLDGGRLAEFVREQAAMHSVRPSSICFEIAEMAAINHIRSVSKFMQELKADGFQFALDGFGLGMSSYTYVKKLPVDYLKIDGSLVKEIAKDPISRAMVAAINEIGHAIGLQTIAENVEDHKVIDTLREICVDYAQGFAIATPQALPGVGNLADFGTAKWPSGRPTTLVRPSSAMAIA